MEIDNIVLSEIRKNIKALPPELEEAVNELAEHMRRQIKAAGDPVGNFALALVGAEMAATSQQAVEADANRSRICPGCGTRVTGTCWECVGDGGLRR